MHAIRLSFVLPLLVMKQPLFPCAAAQCIASLMHGFVCATGWFFVCVFQFSIHRNGIWCFDHNAAVCRALRMRGLSFLILIQNYKYWCLITTKVQWYRAADKSLAGPTSRCILFDGENISFDASLVVYINSTNIPPILIINRIHETQNLLSL